MTNNCQICAKLGTIMGETQDGRNLGLRAKLKDYKTQIVQNSGEYCIEIYTDSLSILN